MDHRSARYCPIRFVADAQNHFPWTWPTVITPKFPASYYSTYVLALYYNQGAYTCTSCVPRRRSACTPWQTSRPPPPQTSPSTPRRSPANPKRCETRGNKITIRRKSRWNKRTIRLREPLKQACNTSREPFLTSAHYRHAEKCITPLARHRACPQHRALLTTAGQMHTDGRPSLIANSTGCGSTNRT